MKTIKDIEYSFDHTRERISERYGIDITREDYNELCRRANLKENVEFMSEDSQKNDVQVVLVMPFKDVQLKVVWSTSRQCITTALSKDHISKSFVVRDYNMKYRGI